MKPESSKARSRGLQPMLVTERAFGCSRRTFLGLAAAGTTSLAWDQRLSAAPGESGQAARALRLTTSGGDRATGYVMSNKIARRDGHLVCTWLDVERQNQWAVVDLARGEILRTGTVGERRQDNHCGVAMTTDTDGTLHLLVGAHHGRFVHYRWPPDKQDWEPVEDGRAVGQSATYPSLVCDGHGTLHLLYRRETNGRDAHLVYCRRPKQGPVVRPAFAGPVGRERTQLADQRDRGRPVGPVARRGLEHVAGSRPRGRRAVLRSFAPVLGRFRRNLAPVRRYGAVGPSGRRRVSSNASRARSWRRSESRPTTAVHAAR